MIRKYFIAGYNICIDYDADAVLEEKLSEYVNDFESEADISINIYKTFSEIEIRENNLIKLSDIAYFYSTPKNDIVFYFDPAISKTIAKIEFEKDYKNVDIYVYELKSCHGVEDKKLVFNLLNIAINYAVQMNSGFVFHSSSVCCNGVGVAFSAKSGTGKSTHTKLWLENFEGSFILNDDTPIISLNKEGTFNISGTPWAGTTGINKNITVPLKAVVFLERDSKNSITQLSVQEAIKRFFEGIKTPLTDAMLSNALGTLNKLLISVPVYLLKCNMEPEAAIISYNGIFGK